MSEQFYYRFIISELPESDEDIVSSWCFDFGAEGVSENLEFEQLDREYQTKTINKKVKTIEAYFSNQPDEKSLTEKIKNLNPSIETKILKEPVQDWLSEWKKGFVPFELTKKIWVVPSWLEAPKQSEFNIFIDPGMAFGTGTHETTQIAADLLIYLKEISPNLKSLIDVGTGTGILAILSSHLGYDKIMGTEIDNDARLVGIENCQLNNVKVDIPAFQIEKVQDSFDVVVANIIDGVLVRIQEDLKRCCSKYMLLTGVLEERESLFLNEFDRKDFKVLKRLQKNEWVGFLLERK
ncbi:MAG: 50S ribosomal protein L11 methyltransferase [Bdellovibrionales bacterium]|nr:50S ribosomal protein L11 methyltransferase [Bdellovibrionales bacterium]